MQNIKENKQYPTVNHMIPPGYDNKRDMPFVMQTNPNMNNQV